MSMAMAIPQLPFPFTYYRCCEGISNNIGHTSEHITKMIDR